jgi:hypothetical protein
MLRGTGPAAENPVERIAGADCGQPPRQLSHFSFPLRDFLLYYLRAIPLPGQNLPELDLRSIPGGEDAPTFKITDSTLGLLSALPARVRTVSVSPQIVQEKRHYNHAHPTGRRPPFTISVAVKQSLLKAGRHSPTVPKPPTSAPFAA